MIGGYCAILAYKVINRRVNRSCISVNRVLLGHFLIPINLLLRLLKRADAAGCIYRQVTGNFSNGGADIPIIRFLQHQLFKGGFNGSDLLVNFILLIGRAVILYLGQSLLKSSNGFIRIIGVVLHLCENRLQLAVICHLDHAE